MPSVLLKSLGMIIVCMLIAACETATPSAPTATSASIPLTPTKRPRPATTPTPSPTTVVKMTHVTADYPGRIAYTRIRSGVDIFVMKPDGTGEIQLTHGPGASVGPTWSPGGRYLVYFYFDSNRPDALCMIDVQANAEPKTILENIGNMGDPSWSPDGRYLVYHNDQRDSRERDIFKLDVTTGVTTNLTANSKVWDSVPTWSPDGQWIAFVSDRSGEGKALDDIWLMKPDGTGLKNLTDNGYDWEDQFPAWSSDGKQIAFFRYNLVGKPDKGGPGGLWVMKADGSQPHLAYAMEGLAPLFPPVWSPDGKQLAFMRGEPKEEDVWAVSLNDGHAIQVSDLPGREGSIAWSPDSRALIFTHFSDGAYTLYIAQPDGSDTRPVFDSGQSAFGQWSR